MKHTETQMLEAISLFADYIVSDRKITNPTVAHCEEIAKHALVNFAEIFEAYQFAKAGA